MKNIQISEDEYLIKNGDKYFIINCFTKSLFEALQYSDNIDELAIILNLSSKKILRLYNKLEKEMLDCPYYEKNLFLRGPVKLQWKITPVCNLKCKHCYLGDLADKQLSEDKLLKIADKISNSNIMELTITGGEALTVKCLPEILEKIIEKNIKVHIFTNAILLESFLNKLPNNKFKDMLSFEVSVDGIKVDHENIRGKGTFDQTLKGIKKAIKLGYYVSTNTVLSKLNYKNVDKLFVFLNKLHLKNIQISNLIDSGRASASMKLTEQEHQEFLEKLKNIISKSGGADKLLYVSQSKSFIYSFDGTKDTYLGKEQWRCGAGIGRATIDYKGNIYCCPFWNKSCLGNIIEDSLSDIWQNSKRYLFLKELARMNTGNRVCIVAQDRICDE